jgi:hypothetical protein
VDEDSVDGDVGRPVWDVIWLLLTVFCGAFNCVGTLKWAELYYL